MGYLKFIRAQWDRTAAVVFALAGLLALLLGWIGVSGSPYIAGQMPYFVSGGLLGIFFLGAGATVWISADLRDEWRELRHLGALIERGQAAQEAAGLKPVASMNGHYVTPQPELAANANSNGGAARTRRGAGAAK